MAEAGGELLVGVKIKPDGGFDTSQALRIKKGELRIPDPVVDRLRGPFVINNEIEARHTRFQVAMIAKAKRGEITDWLAQTLNGIKRSDQPTITADELQSLSLVTNGRPIQVLREQYGRSFIRSYFQLDLREYQIIYERLSGRRGSNACALSGSRLEQDPLTEKIGIILATSASSDVVHEMGHSIDPYLDQRRPRERVLSEFATLYRDTYVPRIFVMTGQEKTVAGRKVKIPEKRTEVFERVTRICSMLTRLSLYADKFQPAFRTKEEYKTRVKAIGDTLTELETHMDKKSVNRAIYNAKSYSELLHLLSFLKQEKGLT